MCEVTRLKNEWKRHCCWNTNTLIDSKQMNLPWRKKNCISSCKMLIIVTFSSQRTQMKKHWGRQVKKQKTRFDNIKLNPEQLKLAGNNNNQKKQSGANPKKLMQKLLTDNKSEKPRQQQAGKLREDTSSKPRWPDNWKRESTRLNGQIIRDRWN